MILETLQISLRFSTQTQITNSCFCLTGAFYNLILWMASQFEWLAKVNRGQVGIFVEGDWGLNRNTIHLKQQAKTGSISNHFDIDKGIPCTHVWLIKRVPLSLTILCLFIVTEKSHKISVLLTTSMCCHECHLYEYHFSNFMVEYLRLHLCAWKDVFCQFQRSRVLRIAHLNGIHSHQQWNGAVCQSC